MSVILVLIPLSIVCAAGFLGAFIWAVRSGQFEDTCTPPMRLLLDDSMNSAQAKTGLSLSPVGTPVSGPASGRALVRAGSETGAPANRSRGHESDSSKPKPNHS